jgi:hypothetical protein
MRVRLMVVTAAIGMACACAGASQAQVPTQDSVTGTAATGFGRDFVEFTFDAHSGPSGENPTGTVDFNGPLVDFGPLEISCLSVSGNRASMIVLAPQPNLFPPGLVVSVEDNGPSQDRVDWGPLAALPSDCPVPSGVFGAVASGDITVTDAPALPTSKDQCKNGGWRNFPGFNNQGDCVSFVATGGKHPPANSP